MLWWRMREALDPNANNGIALPPDRRLLEELTMPRWKLIGKAVYVESRDDLLDPKRLGRSPDLASAYVYSLVDTPKVRQIRAIERDMKREHNPIDMSEGAPIMRDYNPTDPRNWR
jgi:hypothetical protein